MIPPLFTHQRELLERTKDLPYHAFFDEQGTGKTRIVIDTAVWLWRREEIDALLVICPPGVEEVWAEDQIPDFMPEDVQPRCLVWRSRRQRTKKQRRAESALFSASLPVLVFSYEASMTRAGKILVRRFLDEREVLFVLDECFPAGTPIDTPDGPVSIENLRPGDKVLNCAGISEIVSVNNREIKTALEIFIGGSKIITSPNHPFLTTRGWVPAQFLEVGDECVETEEAMRVVRGETSEPQMQVLRKILLSEMAYEPIRTQGEDIYREEVQEDIRVPKEDRHAMDKTASQAIIKGPQKKDLRSQKRKTISSEARWEWNWANSSSGDSSEGTGNWLDTGIYRVHREEEEELSNSLQDRHCQSEMDDSCRDRRAWSQGPEDYRPEEGRIPGRPRVESIQVLELGGHGGSGEVFYDLEVSPHPSYSIHGGLVLVHNSQRIKSPSARRTKTLVAAARHAPYRRILSGTPATNRPYDLWTQGKFLRPSLWAEEGFGSLQSFKAYFGEWEDGYAPGGQRFPKFLHAKNLDKLGEILARFSSRTRKAEVLDLPPKVYSKRYVELSSEQRRMYGQMKDEFCVWLDEGDDVVDAQLAITKMVRLQQILSGFLPREEGEPYLIYNPRLAMLVDMLKNDVEGKAIVWCAFRHDVDMICAVLGERAVRYDGAVNVVDRIEARKAFQNGDAQYFVSNPAVAGVGLTLTAAETAIYYTNSFNLEQRLQSEDRCHRIGTKGTVRIVDFVAKGTIDVRKVTVLRGKERMTGKILRDDVRKWI